MLATLRVGCTTRDGVVDPTLQSPVISAQIAVDTISVALIQSYQL